MNQEIKPNDELISIANDHIKNIDGEKSISTSGKSVSFFLFYQDIFLAFLIFSFYQITATKEKHEEKSSKIITSYGVPLSSVS